MSNFDTIKMKNIIYPILCLLLFSSCSNDFLNTAPTSSYDETFVFSTTDKAFAAVNGMHRAMVMQYSSNMHYGGYPSIMILTDILGDDLVLTAVGNKYWITEYQWQGHRSETGIFPFFAYHMFYRLISNANMILENTDNAEGPEGEKAMIKGQALAYRALSYFWLVQLYGKRYDPNSKNDNPGIPLILSSLDGKQPRATVARVYQQINDDLNRSLQLLQYPKNTFIRPVKDHFTPAIVKGLLARVALTMQDWKNAAIHAAEAIEESKCSLMSPEQYTEGFNSAENPEWLWAHEQSADQSLYYHGFMAFMSYNFGSTNIKSNPKAISSLLYNQISDSDIRKKLWDPTGKKLELPSAFTRKPYMNCKFKVTAPSSSDADIPFMRLAELYLILAEAKAQQNDNDAADILYTLVHQRDPEYKRSANTGPALIQEILLQRRIELWGEGFRFTDLKRLDGQLDRTGSNHQENLCSRLKVEAGDKAWEFLLPQKEINANEFVTQNPK